MSPSTATEATNVAQQDDDDVSGKVPKFVTDRVDILLIFCTARTERDFIEHGQSVN